MRDFPTDHLNEPPSTRYWKQEAHRWLRVAVAGWSLAAILLAILACVMVLEIYTALF